MESSVAYWKDILDEINEFANSDIRRFIENMVTKDKEYFTEEKTNEINQYLSGSGWTFYGKYKVDEPKNEGKPFFFAAFGSIKEYTFCNKKWRYDVGKRFNVDDDIQRIQYHYEKALKKEEAYNEYIAQEKEYWRCQLSVMSQEELIDTLVYYSSKEEGWEDCDD